MKAKQQFKDLCVSLLNYFILEDKRFHNESSWDTYKGLIWNLKDLGLPLEFSNIVFDSFMQLVFL